MVVVVIVSFRNPTNVADCLRALARLRGGPEFAVFIVENGGAEAAGALFSELGRTGGPCRPATHASPMVLAEGAVRLACFDLHREDGLPEARVHVADMAENAGYAGGVNAWLRSLLRVPNWDAVWILNPDTQPRPESLAELAAYAERSGKGMVGAKLVSDASATRVQLRGLAWHRLKASTVGVDRSMLVDAYPGTSNVLARLDAPSGASMYVQRSLVETIGLMDESFFLYYEDLDWGLRAKGHGALGYAERAVVQHLGGSTICTTAHPRERSPLAVYLEFRNRILLVRRHFRPWTIWTVLMQALHVGRYVSRGAVANAGAAVSGLCAGLRGESGRPDRYVLQHRV